jgi:hypothetical protein
MKRVLLLTALFALIISAAFGRQQSDERAARELRDFERDWITADMNRDNKWLEKFLKGRFFVVPPLSESNSVKSRALEIAETIETVIPRDLLTPKNMKVRITGKVSVLTNSPEANAGMEARSYSFLDTFNKQNGKWQLIASNFSADSTVANGEQILIQSERELSNAIVKKDIAVMGRLIADDFTGVENSGQITNKFQVINEISTGENTVQTDSRTDLKVRIFGNTAIVTGRLRTIGSRKERNYNHQSTFTDTWINRNGEWQIVNYQATPIL